MLAKLPEKLLYIILLPAIILGSLALLYFYLFMKLGDSADYLLNKIKTT
jgi:hypothetical protein